MSRRTRGNLFLLLAALVWGMGLVSQQMGMDHLGPWTFTVVRCTLGGISLIPVIALTDRMKKGGAEPVDRKRLIKLGFMGGAILTTMIISQQYGMQLTSVGKTGFITALYILFTPLGGMVLFGNKVSRNTWIGAAVALAGMYLLCFTRGPEGVNPGDLIVLIAAVGSAAHLLFVDRVIGGIDPLKLSCVQFLSIGLICLIPAVILEGAQFRVEYLGMGAVPILYSALVSCAGGYTFQILGQRDTDPAVASLLLSLETVFALMAAWLVLGETLTAQEYLGCAVMAAAIVIAQLPEKKKV